MKKLFIAAVAMIGLAGLVQAQTARNYQPMPLENGDIIYPYNLMPDYEEQESAIIDRYTREIASQGAFKAEVGDSDHSLSGTLFSGIYSLCRSEFPVFQFWAYDKVGAGHGMIRNKKFRAYLSGKVNSFLVELGKIYPRGFQEIALAKIDEAEKLIMEMSKHQYSVKNYMYEGGWTEEVLVKDGVYCIEGEYYDMVHGLEGWIARRMVYDQVPLVEMRNYLLAARKALVGAKDDSAPEFETIYNINDHLKICTLPGRVICVMEGGKSLEEIYKLQYFESKHGVFFKFCGDQNYQYENKAWVAPYGLFAPDGTLIMSGQEWSADVY